MKYNDSEENSRETYWEGNVTSFYNSCKEICQYSMSNEEKEPDSVEDNPSQDAKTEYTAVLRKFTVALLNHAGTYMRLNYKENVLKEMKSDCIKVASMI